MEQPGKLSFRAYIKSDSYIGFDKDVVLEFEVKSQPSKERDVPDYSKEDVMAIKGPGMVQSMLDIKGDEESDEGEDSDEGLTEIERLKRDLVDAGLGDTLKTMEQKQQKSNGH